MGLKEIIPLALCVFSPFFYDCTEENTRKSIIFLILYVKELKIETMV